MSMILNYYWFPSSTAVLPSLPDPSAPSFASLSPKRLTFCGIEEGPVCPVCPGYLLAHQVSCSAVYLLIHISG